MMSQPSYQAWAACNTVWNRLKPSEKEIVKAFHGLRSVNGESSEVFGYRVDGMAANYHVSSDYVWQTVRKAWAMWAIERGLADE